MDIVGNLLPELAQRILLQLDLEEIEIVWKNIEEWKHLFDNFFWKKICKRNDYDEKEGYLTSDIYREYMLESSLHWRAIYKYNQLIESRWSDGNFRFVSIEEDKEYDNINHFDDELLVVSTVLSDTDVNVDIVDLSTGKILFSFSEKKVARKTLRQRHQDLLIFLNYKTLKVWNLETKSWFLDVELKEIEIFPESVHLEIYKNRLVFLHSQECLYIVNLETKGVHLKNISEIVDMCFGDDIIILLSNNTNRITTLDLDGQVLMKIDYLGNLEIEDVMIKGGYIIIYYARVADEDLQKVAVYTIAKDSNTLQEIGSVNLSYRFKCFSNNNTILFYNFIASGFRREIRYMMWKFATKNATVDFGNSEKQLESVAANNCYMFICHLNSTITMWCSETGKFIRIISDKALKNSHVNLKVTENKLAYLNCDRLLCIQNFDFV